MGKSPHPALPPLREVIARHGIAAKHSLGQHFLFDLNLCARIVRAAGDLSTTNVIEIGPGPGGLTRALLDAGAMRVFAIERDQRCIAALEELRQAYPEQLQLIHADALKTDIAELVPPPRRIVANLPYNIATPLLIGWLRQINEFEGLTCMFQSEVADRITAKPSTKAYGRLSIITQWLCRTEHQFKVDRRAFVPPPKVESSVVTLIPRPDPINADWTALETVTAAAFGQRRKMLRTSLKPLNLDIKALGIEPTARAEELSIEQFGALARALARVSP